MDKSKFDYCHVVGCTDRGCKRPANEDNMGTAETINGLVSVVCDGMGGHVGGATASKIAVDTIIEFIDTKYYNDPRICIGEAIDAANRAILKQASIQPELSGMGSTCVVLLVRDGKVYLGHVGDSRIYLIRDRRIKQLTKDHSFVQMLVDRGEITHEQAEHHPRKNEITNALGIADMKPATIMPDAILPMAGDVFLLCSDGLSGMVSDKEIERIVSKQADLRAQERADLLVERAKEHGGLDNITVQLVEFSITPSLGTVKRMSVIKMPVFLAGVFVILAVIIAIMFFLLKNKNADERMERETTTQILKSITFYPHTEAVNISYSEKGITIKLMEDGKEKDSLSVQMVFEADSLSIEDGNVSPKNDNFNANTLRFKLSNEENIVIFEVPVEKDVQDESRQPSVAEGHNQSKEKQEKQAESNKNGKVEGNVAINAVTNAANDEIITYYGGSYSYQKGSVFFSFVGGEENGYCDIPGNNRRAISYPFSIIESQINIENVKKEENENSFSYSFGDIEPEGDIIITINGIKGVDGSESRLAKLEFVLKKQE